MSPSIESKAEVDGGDLTLKINLEEIFKSMSPDAQSNLLQSLSREEVIIKHVTDQILTGFTENISCGATSHPIPAEPRFQIDIARRRIAEASSEVAKEDISRLTERVNELQEDRVRLIKRNNELQWHLAGK